MTALVQTVVIRWAIPKLGSEKSLYTGFLFYSAGLFLFAFAANSWQMFAFIVPYSLGGIAGPALQSIMSGFVPPNEQGELQGALTSLMSATTIFAPVLMTSLFAFFTSANSPFLFPGAPFFLGAILVLVSTGLAYRSMKRVAVKGNG